MKILRSSVFLHYLDEYYYARLVCEKAQNVYDANLYVYKEILNVKDNWSRKSYWVGREEEFYNKRKAKYGTEDLRSLRRNLAEALKLHKRASRQSQGRLSKSYINLQKAIKIQTGINNYNAYDLLDTDEIEKTNIQALENLTKYPPEYENIAGFNPTLIRKQHEAMSNGIAYKN